MNRKKIISLLIAMAVLVGTSALVSCKTEHGKPGESTKNTDGGSDERQYRPDVPEGLDFKGANFDVLGMDPELYQSTIVEFDFDEAPGEGINSAIYKRNRRIEHDYNIVFRSEYGAIEEMSDAISEEVRADEDTYKLIMLISREAFPHSLQGDVMPYQTIPYVNLDQPWYIKNVNDSFSIYGYNVLAYTDECMNAYMQSVCVFFNMGIVKDNANIDNPYDLLEAGKWTLDDFYRLANNAIYDVNGNGTYSAAENDIFGVISEGDAFYPGMWVGSGTTTIEKDRRGMPSYTAYSNEKLIGILEKLTENLAKDGFFCQTWVEFSNVVGGGDAQRNAAVEYFSRGGGLFRVGTIGQIQLLRDMEADFGIVPLPKYDEAQQTYYSRMVDGWIHVAPSTVRDRNMLGVIIEALGAESKNLVIPEFFDVALNYKLIRDEDIERTRKSLDLIFGNAAMDLGETIWQNNIRNTIISMLDQKDNNFVSALTAIKDTVEEKCINETLRQITELKKAVGE